MATIYTIPIVYTPEGIEVLFAFPISIETSCKSDELLELVRIAYRKRWNAKVHALTWTPLRYVQPNASSELLILHVDELGHLSPTRISEISKLHPGVDWTTEQTARLRHEITSSCRLQPWVQASWLRNMTNWLSNTLPAPIRVQQIRVGTTGAVLKIKAGGRTYFLKTVPGFLSREVPLLALLNLRLPNACAQIIGRSPDTNTHITSEIVGEQLCSLSDPERWETAVRGIAEIQRNVLPFLPNITMLGLPHDTFAEFSRNLHSIVTQLINLQCDMPGELSSRELDNIRRLVEIATDDCEALNRCGIPDTIINSDLNSSNVFVSNDYTILIDWTFARIAHPFFTLEGIIFGEAVNCGIGLRTADLQKAYLEPWRDFGAEHTLLAGMQAASRLIWLDAAVDLLHISRLFTDIDSGAAVRGELRRALNAYDLS